MAQSPDFAKNFQDMMSNFPVDTSSFQDAFKSQGLLGEKLAKVALAAAERSTEISAQWTKDAISRMGELAAVKQEPSDYAKSLSDFASASAEVAAEHMAAYAEVAKKVQMDTVDLMMTAGKDVAAEARNVTETAVRDTQFAVKKATNSAPVSGN